MKVYKSKKGGQKIRESYDSLLKKWSIPYVESDITTRYGKTHIVTAGDTTKPPLILFHGVGDDAALMWLYNAAAWAKHFYCIAIDTIGGPGKSLPNFAYNKQFNQGLWVEDILDGLSLVEVYMAGVSNGGAIVQSYIAKRPGRVKRAVCMASGLLYSDSDKPLSRELMKTMSIFLPEALLPTRKNIQKLLKKLCGANSHILMDDAAIMTHWEHLLKYFNNMAMRYHQPVSLGQKDLHVIKDKAFFIIGDRDRIAYSEASIALLVKYGMRYHILKDAGHAINHEESEIINQLVVKSLTGASNDAIAAG